MTRSVLRHVEWHLGPDTSPGAPDAALYQAECRVCGDASPVSAGRTDAPEVWAMRHTGRNPSHTGYKAVTTSYWRMTPVDGTVTAVEPPPLVPAPVCDMVPAGPGKPVRGIAAGGRGPTSAAP